MYIIFIESFRFSTKYSFVENFFYCEKARVAGEISKNIKDG